MEEDLLFYQLLLIIFLVIVDIIAIAGNGLIILAWIFHKPIRTPPNAYLLSLSFADLIVGVLPIPLFIVYEFTKKWEFGENVCRFYLVTSVIMCSASILHLIIIAIDRYRATLDGLFYMQKRSFQSVGEMVLLIYSCAIWLALPLILDWSDKARYMDEGVCTIKKSLGWNIHLSVGMFFLPGFILVRIYVKIYHEIKRRLREKAKVPSTEHSLSQPEDQSDVDIVEELIVEIPKETTTFSHRFNFWKLKNRTSNLQDNRNTQVEEFVQKKITFSLNKERHAFKTLGFIIGAFVISWCPLFLVYTIVAFIPSTSLHPPSALYPALVAMGYSNSAMNPLIYTFYNKEFRDGFKKVICFWRK